jgi:hypothetical protein
MPLPEPRPAEIAALVDSLLPKTHLLGPPLRKGAGLRDV